MIRYQHSIYLLVILTLNSCISLVPDKHITSNYYLTHTDEGWELGYKVQDSNDFIGIVSSEVEAVGYDSNYIIVKQYAKNMLSVIISKTGSIAVKDTSNIKETNSPVYYIVPLFKDYTYYPEKGILGPLMLNNFNKLKLRLKITETFQLNP